MIDKIMSFYQIHVRLNAYEQQERVANWKCTLLPVQPVVWSLMINEMNQHPFHLSFSERTRQIYSKTNLNLS